MNRALLVVLICFLAVGASLSQLILPRAAPADAPANAFSSARALSHVRALAEAPRPVGTEAHRAAAAYIEDTLRRMGYAPEVQRATSVAVDALKGDALAPVAAEVENISARLKGSEGKGSVILVAHYDSGIYSPGASDNAASVAALLETARAMQGRVAPKNDILFLFTDGEEVAALGAEAFVQGSTFNKDTDVVVNLEARGTSGPSIMFETGPDNQGLMEAFRAAAPSPVSSSFFENLYGLMPNYTDYTVFRAAGHNGLNFAFINGAYAYHTHFDHIEQLDEQSLQHQGSTVLALAAWLGDADLAEMNRPGRAVFFTLLRSVFVVYPEKIVLPLTVVVSLFFLAIVLLRTSKRLLRIRDMALGFAVIPLEMIAAGLVTQGWWFLVHHLQGADLRMLWDLPTFVAFMLITLAIVSAMHGWLEKRTRGEGLLAGNLLWWFVLLIATSIVLKGASYLFAWPLLFASAGLGLGILEKGRKERPGLRIASFALVAVPVLVLLPAAYFLVFTALTLQASWALFAAVPLFLGPVISAIIRTIPSAGRWLSIVAVCLALIAGGAGIVRALSRQPVLMEDSLGYCLDADAGMAVWMSSDDHPDAWTAYFLKDDFQKGAFDECLTGSGEESYLISPADAVALEPPVAELMQDRMQGSVRTLVLRLRSPRRAWSLSVVLDPGVQLLDAAVDGQPIDVHVVAGEATGPWRLEYDGMLEEGFELTLTLEGQGPIAMTVIDRSLEIPQQAAAAAKPRPDNLSPSDVSANGTYVRRRFSF